jgi:hypothetical protein
LRWPVASSSVAWKQSPAWHMQSSRIATASPLYSVFHVVGRCKGKELASRAG